MLQTLRTFIAVEIGQDVRAKAAALIERLKSAGAKVRWVSPPTLHYTLKFLGDINAREIPAVQQAITAAVAGLPPFEIEARGAGAFPTLERPRTLWLGVGEGTEQMIELHAALEGSLAELGFRPEGRRFRPHLTLGRVRSGPQGIQELASLLEKHADYQAGRTIVEDVVLFSSQLESSGPVYEPLGHGELAGGK